MIRDTIGPYRVLEKLGEGGMGEVYRARDAKLGRDVAIKILPPELAHDPDRLARFEREARALAALNHPNIGAIYGVEETDGVRALILELVEGPTLAERITEGPIPMTEALEIARQIADALDAAHERGIVHRDLKPSNIKIVPGGLVKVLDFGLAKAVARGDGRDLSQSPTATTSGTRDGMILGTAPYMSPEQARGQAVDGRTDVWAFACVLYEMLTTARAFRGDNLSDTVASVLRSEPDWTALPPAAAPLTRVLQRCLEKDPRRRLRNIADVKLWLDEVSGREPATAPRAAPRRSAWWISAAAILGVVVGGTVGALLPRAPTAAPVVTRFELPASQDDRFAADTYGPNVAISPDGSRIVYTAARRGLPELVVRRLDQLESKPLAGTEGGIFPFFSPDGQQVAFMTIGELRRVPVEGGPSVAICKVDPTFSGASWGPDNTILFTATGFGLFRVPGSGGEPERLAAPDSAGGEENYMQPVMLPGGQAVLYTVLLRSRQTRIVARRLPDRAVTTVVEGGFGPQYLPTGHLVYAQGDRLMAARFDVATLQIIGSPVAVQEHVFSKIAQGVSNFASAADGTAVYVSGRGGALPGRLVWFDRAGKRIAPVVEQPLSYPRNLRLSPDERRVALTLGPEGLGDLWVYDLSGAAQPLKLTFQDHNSFPIWSPDGKRIVFLSVAGSTSRVLSLPADGSAVQAEPLTTVPGPEAPLTWSPDGAFVLFWGRNSLWTLRLSDHQVRPWLQMPFGGFGGRFSPDGRWVAYASDQTGTVEVWVRPFPGPGAPVRVSSDGGHDPVWSRDGKELFYDNGPKLQSARVLSEAPDFRLEAPRTLFEGGFVYDVDPDMRFFDVASDGRFLMIEPTDAPGAATIVVAQHWDEELKRLLPPR